jgi:integrase
MPDGTRSSLGVYDSPEEAAGVIAAAAEQLEARGADLTVAITLSAFGSKWLERRELDGKRNARKERSCWDMHVANEPFAQGSIAAITKRDIRDWVRALMLRRVTQTVRTNTGIKTKSGSRTLARETVKHALNLVRLCLEEAVIDAHIETNPARDIKAPKQPHITDKWTYLTPAEIEAVLTCEKIPEPKRLLFRFAIFTGLRQGEIWGLHWEDVHLDNAEPSITVRHSRSRATKSGKPRELLLLPPAAEALRRWKELTTPKRLVFPAETGGVHHEGYDAGWKDHKDKRGVRSGFKTLAGITRHVRFHDLRHTCASHLVSGSWGRAWRLEEVRDYLGHSNISVTQRYAHMSPQAMRAAVAGTARIDTEAATVAAQPLQLSAALPTIRRHQLGPRMVPRVPSRSLGREKAPAISTAHPAGLEPATVGLEVGGVARELRGVKCDAGPFGGQFLALGRAMLEDIGAGAQVRRSDAVALARGVLESTAVRAAEAVLEADDRDLIPRLVELLNAVLVDHASRDAARKSHGS